MPEGPSRVHGMYGTVSYLILHLRWGDHKGNARINTETSHPTKGGHQHHMVDEHSLEMIQPGAVKHQLARMPCQLMAQVTWYSQTWDNSAPQVALLLKSTDVIKPVATKPSNHIQSHIRKTLPTPCTVEMPSPQLASMLTL